MSEHRLQKILVVHDAELNRQMLADLLMGHYNAVMVGGLWHHADQRHVTQIGGRPPLLRQRLRP